MKRIVRLTENDICRIVKNAIKENSNNKEFERFKHIFSLYVDGCIKMLEKDVLKDTILKIKIEENYNFGQEEWYASYISRGLIENGIILIGINYPLLYKEMKRLGVEKDEYNIKAQARITVGHEVGHGLCDFLRTFFYDDIGGDNEEDIVEEFGKWCASDITGVYFSDLYDYFTEFYKNHKEEIKEIFEEYKN